MKVRCIPLLGDRIYPAELREVRSMVSRDGSDTVLAVFAGTDVEFSPPGPPGLELCDATDDERAALRDAGFELETSS